VEAGAAYTWLSTEVTDSGFDSGPDASYVEGETLLRRPTHALAFRAAGTVAERGRLFTRVSYVGTRADRMFDPLTFAPTRVELDGYTLVTLGAQWNLVEQAARRPSISLSLRAENLFDETYQEAFGFRAPGRQIYMGVTMGLGG
jgi:vitamin B12 transporter